MKKSESITKLAQALAKAQGEMPVVKMNAQNPFLKNKYADLGAVIETSRPVLAKHGLSISQFPVSDGERVGVTSILMHESGEWLEDTLTFGVTDSKGLSVAQASGVVISYARRYSWAAIIGAYADEDVDGHTGKGKDAEAKEKPAPTEAERKDKAMAAYSELNARAKSVKLELPPMDAGWSIEKMTAHYKEQKAYVIAAEEQAKAGE